MKSLSHDLRNCLMWLQCRRISLYNKTMQTLNNNEFDCSLQIK